MFATKDDICSWADMERPPEQVLIECSNEESINKWLKELQASVPNIHVWLVLQPEHRRFVRNVLSQDNIGFLVKPIRRNTLVRQIVSPTKTTTIDHAVRSLREKVKQSKPAPVKKLSILLAEDNPINARLAMAMLSKSGHSVTHVVNGEDAVNYIKDRVSGQNCDPVPDLILMDVFMPKLNGLEATKKIRNIEKNSAKRTPILALTANARKEDQKICQQAGMDGYLAKPFDQHDLEECMAGLMQAKPAA